MKCINNIAEICARKNVRSFILSPGSRCAPLTLSFLRHPDIMCRTVSDERSAAFIALGIAQQTQLPVGLVCTSGTAVLNYAPAITEAFYQKIPLLVFTADRPPEWIDQFDNQSIRQRGIYGRHCLGSFELPVDHGHPDAMWHISRIISEASNLSTYPVKGPVHINVPLREPLYPEPGKADFFYDKNLKIIDSVAGKNTVEDDVWETLTEKWNNSGKKLILVGMHQPDTNLAGALKKITDGESAVVISDITANIHEHTAIPHSDIILGTGADEIQKSLKPDLLITCGGPIVSKYTKLFIRKYKPEEHWHIQTGGLTGDTFQSLTKIIHVDPSYFFEKLANLESPNNSAYLNSWLEMETKAATLLDSFMGNLNFNEFSAIYQVIKNLPENSLLQLGNSMPIRYANFITLVGSPKNIRVNSNRGTSGIDGTLSTTVGASLTTNKITTLIAGDLAFFYDRNGLWNNFLPENLRIIILNNHGGGIFRILDGSGQLPELEEYFETKNPLNIENSARDFNLEYLFCNNFEKLHEHLQTFFNKSDRPKILEIETDSIINSEIFKQFRACVKNLG